MKQLFLFFLGIFSGLCALFFVGMLRFVLEPDYIKPKRNRWDAPE